MASGINLKKAQLAYSNVNKDIKNLETQLANFRKAVAEMNANIWYGGNSANKWYESANAAYKKDCKFLDSLYNIQSQLANKIDATLAASGSTEKTKKSGKGSGTGGGSSVSGAASGALAGDGSNGNTPPPDKDTTPNDPPDGDDNKTEKDKSYGSKAHQSSTYASGGQYDKYLKDKKGSGSQGNIGTNIVSSTYASGGQYDAKRAQDATKNAPKSNQGISSSSEVEKAYKDAYNKAATEYQERNGFNNDLYNNSEAKKAAEAKRRELGVIDKTSRYESVTGDVPKYFHPFS